MGDASGVGMGEEVERKSLLPTICCLVPDELVAKESGGREGGEEEACMEGETW